MRSAAELSTLVDDKTAGAPTGTPAIAVVGAGFCGSLAATWLLRSPLPEGTRIVLIDRSARFGRGLAYQDGPRDWLLNVPADRMSAFSEKPADFLEWARQRDPSIGAGDYLPRALYGEYLQSLLSSAEARSPSGARLERVSATVEELTPHGAGALLTLHDGRTIRADRVVLALGNAAPADPLPQLRDLSAYVPDPWKAGWIDALPEKARVILLGTGLTTIDIALQVARARPKSRILAISRHGLLPREQPSSLRTPNGAAHEEVLFSMEAALGRGPLSTRLRRLREFIGRWMSVGGDWRAVIQRTRASFPEFWRDLHRADRLRFLRHLRAWWDVHRHRVPPQTAQKFESLRARGQISVAAARLQDCRNDRGRGLLRWLPRGGRTSVLDRADVVVNCTGPDANVTRTRCALIRSLLDQGLARPDELGLGWQTAEDGRLIDGQDCASSLIYYTGPLLRGTHWEATAVPELRVHVERTVSAVLHSLQAVAPQRAPRKRDPAFPRSRFMRRFEKFLRA